MPSSFYTCVFPYTTLFRSRGVDVGRVVADRDQTGGAHLLADFLLHGSALVEKVHRATEHRSDQGDLKQCGDEALLRSEEHTSELQSPCNLVCRLLLEKNKI